MKAFKVKYDHGHFIDQETNRRVLPIQGGEFIISATEGAFRSEDEKLYKLKPKNAIEKAGWVAEEYPGRSAKLLDAGSRLFYRVGNSKQANGDRGLEYLFGCELLEDLYIYQTAGSKGEDFTEWRLCECVCKIDQCIEGSLSLSEHVVAPSLNWLFGLTVMFYFNMQRSTACNAFYTFFSIPSERMPTMFDAKSRTYTSLGDLRREYFQSTKDETSNVT
jgi:hypothetical protein